MMTRPASRNAAVSPAALWTGVVGAPLVWVLHELSASAVVGNACYVAIAAGRSTPEPWGRPMALGITVAAIILALAAGRVALRGWRATRPAGHDHAVTLSTSEARAHFMAFAGILLSGIFLLAILFEGLPLILTPLCG